MDKEENLCLACPACNRYKANRITAVDPHSGEEVALFHPRQQSWGEHFVWNGERTEILGRTSIGRATVTLLKINRPRLKKLRQLWAKIGHEFN